MSTVKLPKIQGFHNIYKGAMIRSFEGFNTQMQWLGKVKLHGTNAGIRINKDGTIVAQKRSDDIAVGDDNYGFAAFVEETKANFDFYAWARWLYGHDFETVTIAGEWAGPGIQSGVAVSKTPTKNFYPFSVILQEEDHDTKMFPFDADLNTLSSVPGFHPIPFTASIVIDDFSDQRNVSGIVDAMNRIVGEIEKEDPLILGKFGISGIGEGMVFYPVGLAQNQGYILRKDFEELAFKVKGEEHAVNKAGKPARLKSEIPENAFVFADQHLTESRLKQGLENIDSLEMKNTGAFIGWVCRDIATEAAQEIAESGLDWKRDLSGFLATKARAWFINKVKEI